MCSQSQRLKASGEMIQKYFHKYWFVKCLHPFPWYSPVRMSSWSSRMRFISISQFKSFIANLQRLISFESIRTGRNTFTYVPHLGWLISIQCTRFFSRHWAVIDRWHHIVQQRWIEMFGFLPPRLHTTWPHSRGLFASRWIPRFRGSLSALD